MLNLIKTLRNAYIQTATFNYPYNATVYNPMPANPVNVSCEFFSDIVPSNNSEKNSSRVGLIFTAMGKAANIYLNNGSDSQCINTNSFDNRTTSIDNMPFVDTGY